MKKNSAEIIVLLAHTGISAFDRKGGEENAGYYLTKIPGGDVIVTGHSHMQFPGKAFALIPGVDLDKGHINGVPVVMQNCFAGNIGEIDLTVELQNGRRVHTDANSFLLPVWDSANNKSALEAVPAFADIHTATHEKNSPTFARQS